MRYYDITITPPDSSTAFRHWTSHPNGRHGAADPGALNVEFDMPVLPYDTPSGGQTVIIHGVPLADIGQAQQFTGMNIMIQGGMAQGLPLATMAANQAGVLVQGQIFQSFGNWEGTEMNLAFVVVPASSTGYFVLHWTAGMPLSTALTNLFATAYPNVPVSMNIGSNLTPAHDCSHTDTTLEGLAYKVAETTEGLFKQRVNITIQAGKILVHDATYKPAPIQIAFTDMIGQPTWIDANVMQVKTVMRADIEVGSAIRMPDKFQSVPGLVTTQAASYPSSNKYQSSFKNDFTVSALRQVGNFRDQDASAWCTIFNCAMAA